MVRQMLHEHAASLSSASHANRSRRLNECAKENLSITLGVDGAGHQQRDVANLASPSPLHHDAVEVKVRMLPFDPPVPPSLDLDVNLLVEVRHRARAYSRAPERLGDILHLPKRNPRQIHLD